MPEVVFSFFRSFLRSLPSSFLPSSSFIPSFLPSHSQTNKQTKVDLCFATWQILKEAVRGNILYANFFKRFCCRWWLYRGMETLGYVFIIVRLSVGCSSLASLLRTKTISNKYWFQEKFQGEDVRSLKRITMRTRQAIKEQVGATLSRQ